MSRVTFIERGYKMIEIIKYWRKLDTNGPSYIHKSDNILFNSDIYKYTSYDEYIKSNEFGNIGSNLHSGLIPSPYCGDILNAKIYILMLNPGFSSIDYYVEQYCQSFREAEINCLRQEKLGEYPFYSLNPKFIWTGGGQYWESKLKDIINNYIKIHNVKYSSALKEISKRIALLELIPYHSFRFGLSNKITELLISQKMMKEFVNTYVMNRVENNDSCIIVTRKSKVWNLEKHKNIIEYTGGEARGAHLSTNSRGGKKILEFLL
jgi:hypothetical protein